MIIWVRKLGGSWETEDADYGSCEGTQAVPGF